MTHLGARAARVPEVASPGDVAASADGGGSRYVVVHTAYASADLQQAREFIDRAYGARLRLGSVPSSPRRIALEQHRTEQVALLELDLPLDLAFDARGSDEFEFVSVIAGSCELAPGRHSELYGPGDLFLGMSPETDCIHRSRHSRSRTVSLHTSVFDALIADSHGEHRLGWRFLSPTPVAGSQPRWRRAAQFLQTILADPQTEAAPLILGPATRLLAGTALSIFPNTLVGQQGYATRRDVRPTSLRRAIAFIDARPDLDLSIGDVAREASVTPRALQLAFRRHLDTTPSAYLRELRLSHAHEALLKADPSDGTTVGRVATDWGFGSPSRFAARYRAAYGERPSQTLNG